MNSPIKFVDALFRDHFILKMLLKNVSANLKFIKKYCARQKRDWHKFNDMYFVFYYFIIFVFLFEQLISYHKFSRVIRRVLANNVSPKIPVACFFITQFPQKNSLRMYGPTKELDPFDIIYVNKIFNNSTWEKFYTQFL